MDRKFPCPFVYSTGALCPGTVDAYRAYGDPVRKYRLRCSEKDNHEGPIQTSTTKERMEFYPDQLPPEILEGILSGEIPEY